MQLFERIKKNLEFRGEVYITEIYTLSSFKFKIYGPGLTRPIDLFKIPYHASKMVKKFHMPVVRMWYEGMYSVERTRLGLVSETPNSHAGLKMFDSCVRALLSGVNNSYKWFSCNKITGDIILKYAQRGYTTILNTIERSVINSYLNTSERWGPMFEYYSFEKSLDSADSNSADSNSADSLVKSDIENSDLEKSELESYVDVYVKTEPEVSSNKPSWLIETQGIVSTNHIFFFPSYTGSGIRKGLTQTPCPIITPYSKMYPVRYGTREDKYEGDLEVKTNTQILKPQLQNILSCINYLSSIDDTF